MFSLLFHPAPIKWNATIITVANDDSARIWEKETGKLLARLSEHKNSLSSGMFSSDGKKVLTALITTKESKLIFKNYFAKTVEKVSQRKFIEFK